MKRLAGLFAAVLLLTALFTGCNSSETEKTFTCGELSITLPADYKDLSDQKYAEEYDFLYGASSKAVLGFTQERAPLEEKVPDITAKTYAQMFMEAVQLPGTVTEQDGLVTFTYTANADGTEVTYLCSAFMSETNFWIVQFYCPSKDYGKNEADFLGYLRTVTLQKH